MAKTKVYLNRQNQKTAKRLGYPIDVISKSKPRRSVKIGQTSYFTRYALGNKNYLVAKKKYKLVY